MTHAADVSFRIRPARPDEFATVGALTVAAYESLDGMPLGEYVEELRDVATRAAHTEILVAVEGDRVIGGVTFVAGQGPYAEFDDRDAAGIRMLAVDAAARGRGVGEALVRACLDQARAAGRARVVLHTTAWMDPAHRLYERLGFRRAPERDWEPEPDLVLLTYIHDLVDSSTVPIDLDAGR